MTAYCLMQRVLKHDETHGNYRAARFPPNVGALLLADGHCGDWGIYAYDDYAAGDWSPDAILSDRLVQLIECARRFPPAVALARDDVDAQFREHPPTPDELAGFYEQALEHRLSQQRELGFVLCRAVGSQPGYMEPGQWYWVVAASKSGTAVRWVSDDYNVYSDPAANFELHKADLRKLQRARVQLKYKDEFRGAGAFEVLSFIGDPTVLSEG